MKLIVAGVLIAVLAGSAGLAHAQSNDEIPAWIKTLALAWGEDVISDAEFINAIEALIEMGVINVGGEMGDVVNLPGGAVVELPDGWGSASTTFPFKVTALAEQGSQILDFISAITDSPFLALAYTMNEDLYSSPEPAISILPMHTSSDTPKDAYIEYHNRLTLRLSMWGDCLDDHELADCVNQYNASQLGCTREQWVPNLDLSVCVEGLPEQDSERQLFDNHYRPGEVIDISVALSESYSVRDGIGEYYIRIIGDEDGVAVTEGRVIMAPDGKQAYLMAFANLDTIDDEMYDTYLDVFESFTFTG